MPTINPSEENIRVSNFEASATGGGFLLGRRCQSCGRDGQIRFRPGQDRSGEKDEGNPTVHGTPTPLTPHHFYGSLSHYGTRHHFDGSFSLYGRQVAQLEVRFFVLVYVLKM